MVSVLDCGLSGPGLSPDQSHCVVSSGKILFYQSASLHPDAYNNGYWRNNTGGNLVID